MQSNTSNIKALTLEKLSGGNGYHATLPIPMFKNEVAPDPQLYIEIQVHPTGLESNLTVSRERFGDYYSDNLIEERIRSVPDGSGGLTNAFHEAIVSVRKLLHRRFNKRVKFMYLDEHNKLVSI